MENKGALVRSPNQSQPATMGRPRMQPVVQAADRKPSTARKVASAFIAEDIQNVKTYIIFDVLIPQIKDMILGSIEMLLFGSTTRRARSGPAVQSNRTNYSSYYYNSGQSNSRRPEQDRSNPKVSYKDIGFTTKAQAEQVRDELLGRLEEYPSICIADLKDACDIPSEYIDWNWGWTREMIGPDSFVPVRVNDPDFPWRLESPRVTSLK